MKPDARRLVRWLYPGLRVKRWVILSVLSMGVIVIALFTLGERGARTIYRAFPAGPAARYALISGLLVVGALGFAFSLLRLARSVAEGVAPSARIKPSTMIYRTRVLERGPRVVSVGGGTGLSALLRGLKEETSNITAVVTVMDDGGSSGRLRQEIDVLPPGDVRNCILALAEDETRFSDYFQYRFSAPKELAGHSLGNLLLAGLEQATGGFDRAIEAMSHFLSIRGRVLPATLTKTRLVAVVEDGTRIEGESRISADPRRIERIFLSSSAVEPYEEVLEAISEADLITLGPGSLYTSIIPNLLVDGIAEAIETSPAEKVLIANLMTQPGETDRFTLRDHLAVLDDYIRLSRFDTIFVNAARPADALLAGYIDEAAEPVRDDLAVPNEYGLVVIRADLIGTAHWGGKETIKHDPKKLARAIVKGTRAFSASRR
ncbi:hypothetical protein DRJ24_02465 [Candidatus Acetothermia bacterium]|nr:MAG: hypothetical protein DRJ24_02465 [Candidatus Acetothermia bacterium]